MKVNTQTKKPATQKMTCIIPQTQRLGGLFIGNSSDAKNAQTLKKYGIRAVLTTSGETSIKYKATEIPFHLVIKAKDEDSYPIIDDFQETIQFIHQHRCFTNVLVHCNMGVSRSATLVIAYLMNKAKWNFVKSLDFLKGKRSIIRPNDGFMLQLQQHERQLQNSFCINQNDDEKNSVTTKIVSSNPKLQIGALIQRKEQTDRLDQKRQKQQNF